MPYADDDLAGVMTADNPERALAISYAGEHGAALAALLALDDALATLLRTTTEPALGQMRLAWWREALARLDTAPPPAEPVLAALAAEMLPRGVSGASLVPIVHGWEVLVEEDLLDADALRRFGEGRGSLFDVAGRILGSGSSDRVDVLGQGWALADLAGKLSDAETSDKARDLARNHLGHGLSRKLSRPARSLGALALLARMDLALAADIPPPIGAPSRVLRLLWHRLTGR